ncbi:MAG: major facilitator superfamily 1 [Acidimicrobiaceae bacterium]|nr:major facilitator superfamily 1 [Acidimicrobiaceae bacterium]
MRAAPKKVTGTDRRFDLLSLGTFVAIGLPDGMLGTAWPAMRSSFGAPVGDLGLILLVSSLGSVAVSAFVGRLIHRLGVIALLATASLCTAVGAVGFAVAPGLWLVLCIGPLMGAASGMLDGGLNTAVALTGRPRLLNLLHGFYGIGTALGPLVVTAAILAGSWRPAYLVLVAVDLVAAGSWFVYHCKLPPFLLPSGDAAAVVPVSDETGSSADAPATTEPTAGWSRHRVVSVLSVGLVVFFLYTGLEVGAGQWETSYLRGHLGLSASAAGLAAFGYWGALTVVRILLALPTKSVPAQRLIGGGLLVSVAATALIWWQPDTVVPVAGFVLLGAALAGMFPALIAVTPKRVGERRAQHAIAWQVGAAAGGGSAISALIGLLINTSGLDVLGPTLVVLALLLLAANTALARLAPIPTERVGPRSVRR